MMVRKATAGDSAAMSAILNAIIAIGGTTAHQTPKTAEAVRAEYVEGPQVLSSVVAEGADGVIGWQSVEMWQGEAHIGTFVHPGAQAGGVGTALFSMTCATLRQKGVPAIFASIRADNVPGLGYYARIGFADFATEPGFALRDGRVVGRVHRRFDLV